MRSSALTCTSHKQCQAPSTTKPCGAVGRVVEGSGPVCLGHNTALCLCTTQCSMCTLQVCWMCTRAYNNHSVCATGSVICR
jgi:hypothetical protein